MSESIVQRIPVVAGLGYAERVRRLPQTFQATLLPEPDNRYYPGAIAVHVSGQKVGYLAPEIARAHGDAIVARGGAGVECPGRRSSVSDHETSGVELLLDFSSLGL